MSYSLWHHGMQHARLPCPSLSPRVCSNSCPLGRWCHPTISSSVIPFSSCPQSFPSSGSFPVSQFFTSGGQSIGASASASVFPMNIQGEFPLDWLVLSPCSPRDFQQSSSAPVLPMNIQDWFPLGWTGWISLQSEGISRVFSNTTVQKHQFFST